MGKSTDSKCMRTLHVGNYKSLVLAKPRNFSTRVQNVQLLVENKSWVNASNALFWPAVIVVEHTPAEHNS